MHDRIILVQEEPRGPSQLVEVPVTVNGRTKVQFPDIQQLRSTVNTRIIIKAIRLITDDVLTNGVITGLTTAGQSELIKLSLVIYCEGWEKAQYIPLFVLNDTTTGTSSNAHRYHQTRFNNWEMVDWPKSFLQFSNGTVSVGAPYVVMFDIEYEKLNANSEEIIGPS